jgi:hypothetical protein
VQVLTNQGFVRTRGRLGNLATLLGFACLVGGLFLSWQQNELILLAYATLPLGYLLIMFGSYNTIRWGGKPRVDEILARELKTLDHKYQLINYQDGLPVHNLLLTPFGLVVLEVRPYFGEFANVGSKWRRKRSLGQWLLIFGEGALGNPSRDAERNAAAIREYLASRLGQEVAAQVPVDAVVVFTNPRANLTVEEPAVPVVNARDLKSAVRRPDGRAKLPNDLYRKVTQALRASAG